MTIYCGSGGGTDRFRLYSKAEDFLLNAEDEVYLNMSTVPLVQALTHAAIADNATMPNPYIPYTDDWFRLYLGDVDFVFDSDIGTGPFLLESEDAYKHRLLSHVIAESYLIGDPVLESISEFTTTEARQHLELLGHGFNNFKFSFNGVKFNLQEYYDCRTARSCNETKGSYKLRWIAYLQQAICVVEHMEMFKRFGKNFSEYTEGSLVNADHGLVYNDLPIYNPPKALENRQGEGWSITFLMNAVSPYGAKKDYWLVSNSKGICILYTVNHGSTIVTPMVADKKLTTLYLDGKRSSENKPFYQALVKIETILEEKKLLDLGAK